MANGVELKVIQDQPIEIPTDLSPIDGKRIIAVTTNGKIAYFRVLPGNSIGKGEIIHTANGLAISNFENVLDIARSPFTVNGKAVIGCEDPTFVDKNNPFYQGHEVVLYTQVYHKEDPTKGVYTNLAAFAPDLLKAASSYHPKRVLSPQQATKLGLAKILGVESLDMVKEGEFLPQDPKGRFRLIAEVADGVASHIMWGLLDGEEVVEVGIFRSAYEETTGRLKTNHLSTAGSPIQLKDGRLLQFVNRARPSLWGRERRVINEWGVGHMLLNPENPIDILEAPSEWDIIAPRNRGLGPGDQLIDFASGAYLIDIDEGLIGVPYHFNDIEQRLAIVKIKTS